MRDDEGFLIRHFAGAVCYNTVSKPCGTRRVNFNLQMTFMSSDDWLFLSFKQLSMYQLRCYETYNTITDK